MNRAPSPDSGHRDDHSILVLGATGLVGQHVVHELRRRGHVVVAVSRAAVEDDDPGVHWVRADATRASELEAIPPCTKAISTLAIWLTADVVAVLRRRGLERIVAFSSSSAVTKMQATDPSERELATRLVVGEQRLLALAPDLRSTILRPTLIYGRPGDANVERIASQLRRFGVFPLVGGGRGLRQPVHAADLGAAAVQALQTPVTEGRVYVVAGGETLTVRQMVNRVGSANGVVPRFVRVPLRPANAALRVLEKVPAFRRVPPGALERLNQDLAFDNGPAAVDFGYAPRPFEPPDYETAL